jgi:hypothetical protein
MKVEEIDRYEHIKVVYLCRNKREDSIFSNEVIGQFRSQVNENGGFDEEGKEIWITSDTGFEAFIPVEDILNIERV